LLKNQYFWYAAIAAFFACAFSFAPQFTSLMGLSNQMDGRVAYYTAAYRLLFPLSVLLGAWRFKVRGGLLICVIAGPVILSGVFINSQFPNILIDLGDITLGFWLAWVIGRQGELKQHLVENTAELSKKAAALKQEITERKRLEEQYRIVAEHSADVIYKMSIKDGKFSFASPSAERLLGYSMQEALNIKLNELLTPESFQKQGAELFKDLQSGITSSTLELDLIHKDGRKIPFEVHSSLVFNEKGEPVEIVGVARDITQRKKMEEQIIVQDRLASIGLLTSGLAHELNNPLTSIISFSSLLMKRELAEDVKQDVISINNEAQRIAGVVRNLLAFSRKQPPEKQPTSINDAIRKVIEMRTYEQKVNNIRVDVDLEPTLPLVMGNSHQLEQVFFNIIMNAEFFMLEAHGNGILKITTEKDGELVRASFTDNGPGISGDNLRHLFTPLFTTKQVGKGTGLGLSICLGIINEHGGKIYADSQEGRGTTFNIELPVISQN